MREVAAAVKCGGGKDGKKLAQLKQC